MADYFGVDWTHLILYLLIGTFGTFYKIVTIVLKDYSRRSETTKKRQRWEFVGTSVWTLLCVTVVAPMAELRLHLHPFEVSSILIALILAGELGFWFFLKKTTGFDFHQTDAHEKSEVKEEKTDAK
jgi:hypothetical protein